MVASIVAPLFLILQLYADPNDADDDVHALALAAVIFEAPHTVCLLVPECLGGGVHASSADMWLSVRSGGIITVTCCNARAVGLCFASAFGLV